MLNKKTLQYQDTPERRFDALNHLLSKMFAVTKDAGAKLLVLYIPRLNRDEIPAPPKELLRAVKANYIELLDITLAVENFKKNKTEALTLLNDAHPSSATHALFAKEIDSWLSEYNFTRDKTQ